MVDVGVRVLAKTGVEGFFEFGDLAVGFRDDGLTNEATVVP